jgi:rhodanese-related sulfurtransferase
MRGSRSNFSRRIEGAELIPMRSVGQSLASPENEDQPIVVFCHRGVLSLQVVGGFDSKAWKNCVSMSAGIDQWSLVIDTKVPRYS